MAVLTGRPVHARGVSLPKAGQDDMADIFHEVDEDVRRDQAAEFWKKHQTKVIAAMVVVVAAAGGWRYYQNSARAAAEAAGARFEQALALSRADKSSEADDALKAMIAQGPAGYALLARFKAASELAKSDPAKAVTLYDALAGDAAVDASMRDIARLRAALLRLDSADFAESSRRLEPLAQPRGSYRNTAREFLALAALKAGDFDAAATWYDRIVLDPTATAEARGRAETLLGLVSASKPKG